MADLAEPDAPDKLVAATLARFGNLDLLVNNVGAIHLARDLVDFAPDDWGQKPPLTDSSHVSAREAGLIPIASTPIGMRVTAEARLVAVVGQKLSFLVTCRDKREIIGKGNHERTLIRPASFMRRAVAAV